MDERVLQVLAWADDLYLFAERKLAIIKKHALFCVGLHLRVEQCRWMARRRRVKAPEADAPTPTPLLYRMVQIASSSCMKVLGTYIQGDGAHDDPMHKQGPKDASRTTFRRSTSRSLQR